MLLQSHAGEVELLPALPKAWPSGSVRGLRARGAVGVDLAWRDGRLSTATLVTKNAGPVRLRTAIPVKITTGTRAVATRAVEPGVVEFTAAAGATYTVTP